MSGARSPDSQPLRFPMGVRTASMITGCAMTDVPPAATPGPRPAALDEPFLEPVLTLAPALRPIPVVCPGRNAGRQRPPVGGDPPKRDRVGCAAAAGTSKGA